MSWLKRTQLIQQLASGLVAPRDVSGLSQAECVAIARRADEAFERGDAKAASLLLELLQMLEPDVPGHLLRHAEVLHALGPANRPQILELIRRYLDVDLPKPNLQVAAALRLRGAVLQEPEGDDVRAAAHLERLEQHSTIPRGTR